MTGIHSSPLSRGFSRRLHISSPSIDDLMTRDANRDRLMFCVALWSRVFVICGTQVWDRDISKSLISIDKPENFPVDTYTAESIVSQFYKLNHAFICTFNSMVAEIDIVCLDREYDWVRPHFLAFESEYDILSMAVDCYCKLEKRFLLPVRVIVFKTKRGLSGEQNKGSMASVLAYVDLAP